MPEPNDNPLFDEDAVDLPDRDDLDEGLTIDRVFSTEGEHPFESCEWETRSASISNSDGETIFEQSGVEFPEHFSQLATNVVASKYFYGDNDEPNGDPAEGEREYSLKQLVNRVTRTIADWGKEQDYFASEEDAETFYEELTWLCTNQYGAFNSPVWFNVGLGQQYGVRDTGDKKIFGWDFDEEEIVQVDPYVRPQASACFIVDVEDSIDGIWETMGESARLFKFGSGVGSDWSTLRSTKEKLSGGGIPSGPVSFMEVQDATGGTIKSGGKTRRAAIMQTLKCWHPDMMEFVEAKQTEEKKAHALIEQGYDGSFNGPAYGSVAFQNVNQSLRVTDEFMEAAEEGKEYPLRTVTTNEVVEKVKADEVLNKVAEGTHVCGDPGLQYEDTIQKWHTCPNTDRINSSNPCSEYMFLDNSACNLASLNLRKYQNEDGSIDVERLRAAARIFITAQEILVDNAGYPSEAIARNSHAFRPLGLGFANLGALLMSMGFPYDSDEGRAVAGAVQAIIHSEAYARSAEIAANEEIGPFDGYAENEEPFLQVMRQHQAAVEDISRSKCPDYLLGSARESAARMVKLGEDFGYRNAQSTVIAPTGTIGFYMDCDTKGIEPDLALVKYKLLAGEGDGMFKMVNKSVPVALERLGYSDDEIESIVDYIEEHDTIEGAPKLKDEHLPVFDCAFEPKNGERSIHHMGHIRMMGAVQPFVSGAISKCVTGDTLITTGDGLIPIQDFYQDEEPDSFRSCDTKLGSVDGPREADAFYYGGVRPTIELTLADGRTIEGTPNHRVRVADGETYRWKELRDITADDHVALRLGADLWAEEDETLDCTPSELYGCQKDITLPSRMSPELAWLLGAFASEGSVTRSTWTVRITNNCDAVLDKAQRLFQSLFGLEAKRSVDPRNGVKDVGVASKTLVEFLDYLGCGNNSGSKQIPRAVLQSRRETVRAFLGGLWLDGYVRGKDGMTAICLKSENLIRQLQVVLNNFGLRANIHRKYNSEYDRYFHELCMHGHDVVCFADLVALDEPYKQTALNEAAATLAQKPTYAWSDVVPCHRDEVQAVIRADHATQAWRSVFDKRTNHLSRDMVSRVCDEYEVPVLNEIVENDIHFVQVREIDSGFEEVYDFHVPSNHTFIGNGIVNHNTVNMPESATVEDIADAYHKGWDLGLKAIAIYRENSKKSQPMSTSEDGNTQTSDKEKAAEKAAEAAGDGAMTDTPEVQKKVVYKPTRKRLPDERPSITHKFSIAGHEGYLTVGLYPESVENGGAGRPGEIFITMAKQGSTLAGMMDAFATSISIALQYGVPLEDLCRKFSHMRFEPSGFTNNKQVPIAKSIMDYIFRYLSLKFLDQEPEPDPEGLRDDEAGQTVDPNSAAMEETSHSGEPAVDTQQAQLDFGEMGDPTEEIEDELIGQTVEAFMDAASEDNGQKTEAIKEDAQETFQNQADSPPCPECGSITIRSGACYECPNCGASTGCG